ncbi:MAG: hypothetical protein LRY36_01360 [Alphaproteobacteria bacterium]|nr:hypothetical protein [Alphaproteobacteria bacterium]MCD8566565.1 hypothetical protein [Alphaproteobacteria bacterium]
MPKTLLISYVLTAALRDRLIIAFVLMLAVAASLSIFLSSAAVVEQAQFALVFAGGALRLFISLALVLFVVFHMRRSFDSKDVDFLLSRPVSRLSYILSHSVAFSLLALLFSALGCAALIGISGGAVSTGQWLWMVSVCAEAVIMVNLALFFAMVISSAVGAALACFGFYVLGRMMGQILGIIDSHDVPLAHILQYPMQLISMLMPRLDLMGQTSWLIYELDGDAGFIYVLGHAAIFVFLICCASLVDLVRRQF